MPVVDEAVWVRNTQGGPTVFTDSMTQIQIEWAGAGDPSGNDVQQVPGAVLRHVQFMRHVQKGIYVVEDASPEITAIIDRQTGAFRRQQADADAAVRATIVEEVHNDIIVLPCVGPQGRGKTGQCGEDVMVREKQRNAAPPLCGKHADLKYQFVPESTDEIVDGEPVMKWVRTSLAPRERASAAVVATP